LFAATSERAFCQNKCRRTAFVTFWHNNCNNINNNIMWLRPFCSDDSASVIMLNKKNWYPPFFTSLYRMKIHTHTLGLAYINTGRIHYHPHKLIAHWTASITEYKRTETRQNAGKRWRYRNRIFFYTDDYNHQQRLSLLTFCAFTQVTLVLSSLLLAAVAVSAYPAVQNPESRAVILSQDSGNNPDGTSKNKYVKWIF